MVPARYLVALAFVLAMMHVTVAGRHLLQDEMENGAMEEAEMGPTESDVPCSTPATYSVLNKCDWSQEKFPRDYPAATAHWSPLCGTTHNSNYTMWRVGELASTGVKIVAEVGSHSTLNDEVDECVGAGNCGNYVLYPCSPFSGTCDHTGEVDVTMDMPYLSLVSMIAPSPDWFTGIRDVKLCGEGGNWIQEYSSDLGAYDSGTDSGASYGSPDEATDPPVPIFSLNATDDSNLLYNTDEMKLYPVCSITISLMQQ